MQFIKSSNFKPKPDPKTLVFGRVLTDYMLEMDYENGKWEEIKLLPVHDFTLSPAAMVFHYGQEIFEGCKAYRNEKDEVTLFRLKDNLRRFNQSAQRLAMPQIDVDMVFDAIYQLVKTEKEWIPTLPYTSLYLRPTMIATEPSIGIKTCTSYKFYVVCSPVGAYIGAGGTTRIFVEDHYVRAAVGGTGEAKCGGNYAGCVLAQDTARKRGFSQVAWLDAKERKYFEEVGAMNLVFVFDNEIVTPELTGSILRGITRDSILQVLRKKGYNVSERRLSVDEVFEAGRKGTLREVFGCGTAAVITAIGYLEYKGEGITINDEKMGPVSTLIYDAITGIQTKRHPDEFGWVIDVK